MLNGLRITPFTKSGEFGNVLPSSELGAPAAYENRDGRLVTSLGGAKFDVYVYKVRDRYYAPRNNEFGYANYEVEPKTE